MATNYTTEELLNKESRVYSENPYFARPGESVDEYMARTGANKPKEPTTPIPLPEQPITQTPTTTDGLPTLQDLVTASKPSVDRTDLERQMREQFAGQRSAIEGRFGAKIGEFQEKAAQQERALGGQMGTGRRFSSSAQAFIKYIDTENQKVVNDLTRQKEEALASFDFELANMIEKRIANEVAQKQQDFENMMKAIEFQQRQEDRQKEAIKPIIQSQKEGEILKTIEAGETNINNILKRLRPTFKDISIADVQNVQKAIAISDTDKKYIRDLGKMAGENGADQETINNILQAQTPEIAMNFASDFLRSPEAKAELDSIRLDQALKRAQINKVSYELDLLKEYGGLSPKEYANLLKEEQKEIEKAETESEQRMLQGEALEKKIILLDSVLDSKAIDSVVGPSFLARRATDVSGFIGRVIVGGLPALQGVKDYFTGDADRLVGQVEQFISKEFLDNLINVKAQGATFGALQKSEQDALTAAATFIGQRKIYKGKGDDRQVVGYDMSEKDFRKELKTIQDMTRKAYERATGKKFTTEEENLLNKYYQSTEATIDGASYFK
jgi:hypothetical protein